jgi:hypothetical protein
MKRTSLYLCLITGLLLLMACAQTPEPVVTTEEKAAPTIQGVWKIDEIETVGGPDAGTRTPQACLIIFTKQYYSSVRDSGAEPRALWKSSSPSEKEIVAAYNGFGADSGTYEFDGSTFVIHPSVAFSPNLMSGGSISFDCQLEGDTLTYSYKPDQVNIPGMEVSLPFTEIRHKLSRLE